MSCRSQSSQWIHLFSHSDPEDKVMLIHEQFVYWGFLEILIFNGFASALKCWRSDVNIRLIAAKLCVLCVGFLLWVWLLSCLGRNGSAFHLEADLHPNLQSSGAGRAGAMLSSSKHSRVWVRSRHVNTPWDKHSLSLQDAMNGVFEHKVVFPW